MRKTFILKDNIRIIIMAHALFLEGPTVKAT